jgi:hypothetical protein
MSYVISLIQLSLSTASTTKRFFLLLCLNRTGNIAAGDIPSNVQNYALLLLCTVTRVATANRAQSTSYTGSSDSHQGFSGVFHWYHNHLILSARLKRSMSMISRPPQCSSLHTLHFSPCKSGSPPKGNALIAVNR